MFDAGFYIFFFNDTATTEIYTLSLHDALPIFGTRFDSFWCCTGTGAEEFGKFGDTIYFHEDRKSTRLNSSHLVISYAVFCLKKKNQFTTISSHRSISCLL